MMGSVSNRRVDELGMRVEKLAALLDILGEERVDQRRPRRPSLGRLADQGIRCRVGLRGAVAGTRSWNWADGTLSNRAKGSLIP